jgi:hypothetical protein
LDSTVKARREVEGLCATCAHRRAITSRRGSMFVLCGKSAADPRFPRYPRLPVVRCDGFTPADPTRDARP